MQDLWDTLIFSLRKFAFNFGGEGDGEKVEGGNGGKKDGGCSRKLVSFSLSWPTFLMFKKIYINSNSSKEDEEGKR